MVLPDAVKRALLASLMAVLALNVWTGGPLLALWVGSRVQGGGPPSMGAVAVVIGTMILIVFVLYQLLKLTGQAYDSLRGETATVRAHAPWLRSMRDERPDYPGMGPRVTGTERILVVVVIIAAVVFETWFFFFSGSPIGSN